MIVSKKRMLVPAFLAAGLLAGCGDRASKPEAREESNETEVSGVTFKEGRGLRFLPETAAAIGLRTAPVVERAVPRSLSVTARTIAAGPPALLAVSVSVPDADWLEKTPLREIRVTHVNRAGSAETGMVDLTLSSDRPRPSDSAGDVPLTLTAASALPVVAAPKGAVLHSADGDFAYVVSGDHLLRTPVKTGAEDDAFIEITDGLYPGDIIATTPVEQLRLIELRIVKGGAGCGC